MSGNLVGFLASLAVSLGVALLTFSSSTVGRADLVLANGAEPRSLDPALVTWQHEGRIVDALFEGLTRLDPTRSTPQPALATSWDVSDDGLTWTFHLRQGARWTDGTAVTAHDVAWSWRRLEDPTLAAQYAYFLHVVRWAEAYNTYGHAAAALVGPRAPRVPIATALRALSTEAGGGLDAGAWRTFVREQGLNEVLRGVEDPVLLEALAGERERLAPTELATIADHLEAEGARRRAAAREAERVFGVSAGVFARDDRTLVVELRALTPYFLELVAFHPTYPVPRRVVQRHPTDWFLPATIVSNGPLRLAAWRVNERIRLEASPTYWGRDEVRLGTVDLLPIDNRTTNLNLYLTGAVDVVPGQYPPDVVADLRQRPDFYTSDGLGLYFYRLNCTRPPLDDARVRQALCLAVDRAAIVEHVIGLGNRVATTVVPPLLPGYESPATGVGYDPQRARALLAEAGHAGGAGLGPIGIAYNTDEAHAKIAENVAFQLRQNLGLDVRAYNQEGQAFRQAVRERRYDIARASWIGDYLDPNTFLDLWVTNGGNNQTGWSSALYDRLLAFAADVGRFAQAPDPWVGRLREPERARRLVQEARAAQGPGRVEALGRLRLHLLREAEALLVQEGFPVLPICFYVWSGLVAPRVGGYHAWIEAEDGSRRPNLRDVHPLRAMFVVGAEAGR